MQALADAAAAEGPSQGEASASRGGAERMGRKRKGSSSRYMGVTWNKSGSSWGVQLWDPSAKRNWHIGCYGSEADAGRAYDCAAVKAYGAGVRRNFPGEDISEPPATMGEQKKQRSSSLYTGVTWSKAKSLWHGQMTDPLTKRTRHVGYFVSEVDAARAYDDAAVKACGPGARRNFPTDEAVSAQEPAAAPNKKQRTSSEYIGISWSKAKSAWHARLWDPESKRERHIGCFASEEDAARAHDRAAVQAHGPGAKRNFPGEDISELSVTLGVEQKRHGSSRCIGVSWHKARSAWLVQGSSSSYIGVHYYTAGSSWGVSVWDSQNKRQRHIGYYATEEVAARAYDKAAVKANGPGTKVNFPSKATGALPVSAGRATMRYIGVGWDMSCSAWKVQLLDPQIKRNRHIGYFASERDAARAYDCAAVQAYGPAVKRNFPGEAISEMPLTVGEHKRQRISSRFIGVTWDGSKSAWRTYLTDPRTKRQRHIGSYDSEEEAARAYDSAAVQVHGPAVKRNFPGVATSELPVVVVKKRKQRNSSRFMGVSWHKAKSSWAVQLTDPQTKRSRHIGYVVSEEDAARAYDRAAVEAHGPGAKRNFPDEDVSEMPVTAFVERKQRGSSRFLGVYWHTANSSWHVRLTDPLTKSSRHVGGFTSEEDAARAYDAAAVQAHGPSAKRNFPTAEAVSGPPAADSKLPAADSEQPVADSELRVGVSDRPAVNREQPAAERELRAADSELPVGVSDRPAVNREHPAAERELRAADSELPVGVSDRPAVNREQPAAERELRVADSELPTAHRNRPVADSELPAVNREQPAAERELRAADSKLPAAHSELRAGDNELPVAHSELRAADRELHAADSEQPVGDSELRAAASEQPVADSELPVGVSDQPVSG
ncbi:hypothetical protein FOA52_011004 [Chlamydomonas sp. UWO 241]|nr:hypothetical protein FOA52_011004 [Chlamydomonas sp. UWO 241]